MLTYRKSTLGVLHTLMHFSSGRVTSTGEFYPHEFFPQTNLRRRVDSCLALPQIFTFYVSTHDVFQIQFQFDL